jgi:hypothetical protein
MVGTGFIAGALISSGIFGLFYGVHAIACGLIIAGVLGVVGNVIEQ